MFTTAVLFVYVVVSRALNCSNTQSVIRDWSVYPVDTPVFQHNQTVVSDSALRHQIGKEEFQHVAFLKVHKTASSTVTNIIQRFGWKRHLNFILPSSSPNLISQNESITEKNILHMDKDETFDILCNHVLYDQRQFSKYLPKDTVYIGIVREPFAQFVSSVYYYKFKWSVPYLTRLPNNAPIKYLLQNPKQYEPKRCENSFTKNRMSVDFGLPKELFYTTDRKKILPYLRKLHTEFKLVMIKEYFDESLILLRRLLGWNIQDIIYVKMNSFNYVARVSYRDRHLHKQHSFLDYCLYNYFLQVFWRQVRQQGEDFHTEVSYFRQLRSAIEDFCLEMKKNSALHRTVFEAKETEFHSNFIIDKDICGLLMLNEVEFSTQLKWRQFPHLRIRGNRI